MRLLPGQFLFRAGDPGRSAYLVESGTVEIRVEDPSGVRMIAACGPGEFVGEMAIIDGGTRSAHAVAATEAVLYEIPAEQFARRLAEADPIVRLSLGILLRRLRGMLGAEAGLDLPVRTDAVDLAAAALEEVRLERELAAAIRKGQLELHYQPIVDLPTGRLAGLEALVRWKHPTRGFLSPAVFVPIAEASGLITELTRWAVAEVCRVMPDLAIAAAACPEACAMPVVAVNVSGRDLGAAGFADEIEARLAEQGIDPRLLKLEITESTLMADPEEAITVLKRLRAAGIGIAVDDFGTGYSSLAYLARLPFTTLKVDRSFVAGMSEPTGLRIVQTIIRLADQLAVPVVAEGIETAAQHAELVQLGCRYGQGWLFGRPQPLGAALETVRTWGSRLRRIADADLEKAPPVALAG
ncbi:EAL domain-containing protein [Prosthecomicrobium sp. N25]|uniref:EAL domain-containing protein n=1 Tax=Prosthecomicrobium sp. N25 TaxID=3129254 RepID=UPI0030780615